MKTPPTRRVIVAFTEGSHLPDRRLTIPRRGSIWAAVSSQLTPDEITAYIGIKDSTGSTWID